MTKATQRKPKPTMLCLVGPTAVGKTALALDVARERGAIVLSCDAYAVYRGMDIGTAKPTPAEQALAPHRGIDLVSVTEPFSIEHYQAAARACLDEAAAAGVPVLVTGGSGFYLKSFFAPVVDQVEIPDAVRSEVAVLAEREGLEGLQRALRPYVGDAEVVLDWQNPRRLTKALERCRATGKSLSALRAEFADHADPFPDWHKEVCLLERERSELHERIERRVDAMLAAGLVEEVAALREAGLERNPTAAAAIGYRETLAFLRGELPDRAALREAIVVHTRQLARKQITWFRRQIPIHRHLPAASATPAEAFPEPPSSSSSSSSSSS